MTIKFERRAYVQCDTCPNTHDARELSTYAARVKAGSDGWMYTDPGKGEPKHDQCHECWGHSDEPISRYVPQGSDAGGAGEETI